MTSSLTPPIVPHTRYSMPLTKPQKCRAARAILKMKQDELGKLAGINHQAILRFEAGLSTPHPNNLKAIWQVFTDRGVVFTVTGGIEFKPIPLPEEVTRAQEVRSDPRQARQEDAAQSREDVSG